MTRVKRVNYLWFHSLIFVSLACSSYLHASENSPEGMVHIHMGPVTGSYAGPVASTFQALQSLNFEYEFLKSNKTTNYIRSLMAFDGTKGRLMYFLNAFGVRNYFNSSSKYHRFNKEGESYTYFPRYRFFYGADVGISQVVVQELGTVLQATSTMIDIGGHIGASYHVRPQWALEFIGGYSYGYGFSTVAVTGTTMRIMVGGSYYY